MKPDPLNVTEACQKRNQHLRSLGKLLHFENFIDRIHDFVEIREENSICGLEFWAMASHSTQIMPLDGWLKDGEKIDLGDKSKRDIIAIANQHRKPICVISIDYG